MATQPPGPSRTARPLQMEGQQELLEGALYRAALAEQALAAQQQQQQDAGGGSGGGSPKESQAQLRLLAQRAAHAEQRLEEAGRELQVAAVRAGQAEALAARAQQQAATLAQHRGERAGGPPYRAAAPGGWVGPAATATALRQPDSL